MTYVKVDDPAAPTQVTEERGPSRFGEPKVSDGSLLMPPAESGWTDDLAAACGFLPVTRTPRPADTDTTTFDRTIEVVGGTVTEVWTERPKTQAELDRDAAREAAQAQRADLSGAIATLRNWSDTAAGVTVTQGNAVNVLQQVVNNLSTFYDRFADLLEQQGYS